MGVETSDGRPQGPTHRILSPLAPTIQRIGPPRPCMVGALVVAHPCPPSDLFSLFERYWAANADCRPEQEDISRTWRPQGIATTFKVGVSANAGCRPEQKGILIKCLSK